MPLALSHDTEIARRSIATTSVLRFVSVLVALFTAASQSSRGAIITAASPSQEDVAAAIARAADGDTVQIPAGTAAWSRPMTISKAITLQGVTHDVVSISSVSASNPAVVTTSAAHGLASGQAIWISEVLGGSVAAGAPKINGAYVATVTGATTFTIPKNVTAAPSQGTGWITRLATIIEDNGSSDRLLVLSPPPNGTVRLTQIEFRRGSRGNGFDGLIMVSGTNTDSRRARIDQCAFNNLNGFMIRVETALGVAENNVFRFDGSNFPFYIYHRNWNGGVYSEGSWSAPTNFGSEEFWFVEDNIFESFGNDSHHRAFLDSYGGARYVVRYNTIVSAAVEAHGTESSGRWRGTRAIEVYNNEFRGTDGGTVVINLRGGTAVIHGNRISRFQNPPWTPSGPYFALRNHRTFYPFPPWGAADGTNAWDKNIPGGPFATHIVSSAAQTKVTVSGAKWTPDQWVGYSIVRTSNRGSGQNSSYITGNTAETISYASDGGYAFGNPAQELRFSAGDTFQIWRVEETLDQPGRTGGSLIQGDTPAPRAGGNDQVDDPIYAWDNTRESGVSVQVGAGHPPIRANEHYFNGTPRPGYSPYTYPHPLRGPHPPAAPREPNSPSNLRVTGN
jgi:hypothetical protein